MTGALLTPAVIAQELAMMCLRWGLRGSKPFMAYAIFRVPPDAVYWPKDKFSKHYLEVVMMNLLGQRALPRNPLADWPREWPGIADFRGGSVKVLSRSRVSTIEFLVELTYGSPEAC
jgi:hypothetical protein